MVDSLNGAVRDNRVTETERTAIDNIGFQKQLDDE